MTHNLNKLNFKIKVSYWNTFPKNQYFPFVSHCYVTNLFKDLIPNALDYVVFFFFKVMFGLQCDLL